MSHKSFRKVAVLGAGVMGAQIAAHLANSQVEVILFELASENGDPRSLVTGAIERLAKLKPAPLATPAIKGMIQPATYSHDLPELEDCDLVIEAIAERMDWKKDLYEKVAPHLSDEVVFASNTSGLSINELSSVLPEALRDRFCGVHFFNPPRYMHLAELIPTEHTRSDVLDRLESFLTQVMGKGVIRAKDTPNFIANRIGVFSMLAAMHHTQRLGLDLDVVDGLTGPLIGRPKSATYRTADVVGLDTMGHVIGTMEKTLAADPWHAHFAVPKVLDGLVKAGALGQKTGAGFYRKQGRTIEVLDPSTGEYRDSGNKPDAGVVSSIKGSTPDQWLAALRESEHPHAQFLWSTFRDVFHYAAVHLGDIADNARDLDLAMRWGFGWSQGPFELWQAAGWKRVAGWIREEIEAGNTMSEAPLPDWVDRIEGPYSEAGAYSPARDEFVARSDLPVYARQRFPQSVPGETGREGHTVSEGEAVRLWHDDDGILVASITTKMHTLGPQTIAELKQATEIAESDFDALVIWPDSEPFSVGANLKEAMALRERSGADAIESMIADFQKTTNAMRYCDVPTVAAVRGMALGGGCELLMHCDHVVAAQESYIGLVEVGVGLLPAGGGLKELARRASLEYRGTDLFAHLRAYFEIVAKATVSASALDARRMGLLGANSTVVAHGDEILHVARVQARALADSGYRAPVQLPIEVAGDVGIANFKMMLVNMLEGHFISEHDYEIGSRVATVICGGEIERGSRVDEEWLLRLEREHFAALMEMEKTQERIQHTMNTGKPLRN